jgi:NAD(P)-dependent dehydrogenase (short-subunit alcohol dehydrogenase family)
MIDFKNRVAIVTGGAAGIGAAIVRCFVAAGARVGFCDVDAVLGSTLAHELGDDVYFSKADVSQRPEVEAFIAATAARFGPVDYLVNNAGITHDRTNFAALDFSVWSRILDVNLNGVFFATQSVLPYMTRGGGSIINVGSILAEALFAGKTAYATSKAAVAGFTKALALDLAPRGIRVNCIIPGSIDTAMMWRGLSENEQPDAARAASSDVPLGRVGAPEEVAAAAAYLVSDAASYVTGTNLLVDGGLLARIAASR